MSTIKELAQGYKPHAQLKNIAELQKVPVDMKVESETRTDQDGLEYTVNFVAINGDNYRIPDVVLKDLKALLEKMPTLKEFTVAKTGSGMATRYTTMPSLA